MSGDQGALRAVLMRGGTSRALCFHEGDLPPTVQERGALFLEVLGSPDSLQVDGLGGGASSTSKVMIIRRSDRPGCDIDFTFAQVGVVNEVVDYRPNSGNASVAVGAFAVDEGLVQAVEPVTQVTMFNTNHAHVIRAHVPVVGGKARVQGGLVDAGIARSGAPIENEHLHPAGAILKRGLLPTGNARDVFDGPRGPIEVSVVDAANLIVFVRASDLGLEGTELPLEVNASEDLLRDVEALRGVVAASLGLVDAPEQASTGSPIVPLVVFVTEAREYRTTQGTTVTAGECDFLARAFSLQRLHHAYPMTGLICTAAAAATPGTIPHEVRGEGAGRLEVVVGHAKGTTDAKPNLDASGDVASVSIVRTARRLMAGEVYHRLPQKRE